jgi:alpha-amylase/alpha-mannosidase (GH57 family)
MTRLMLLWHMHQPYYKDLVQQRYTMPWVRLHALKDYFGMVALLRDFPSVHVTFNLVPSLISQLLDYAEGTAREENYELAFKPAAALTAEDKTQFIRCAFQINHENLLRRYPRFSELFGHATGPSGEPSADRLPGTQDWLDLQLLSQLAWMDEIYLAEDSAVRELVRKGRDYTEDDKRTLEAKQSKLLKAILEEYRAAAARGQVELSTSPFYHPILPLLCDTDAGEESCPGLALPSRPFRHPEDARAQLQAAVQLHEKTFGERPRGLWPSEGSVSNEALAIAAAEGFEWAATDEGVLSRSLRVHFHRHDNGATEHGNLLYQPYQFDAGGRPIRLFFRDHPLSDLIGFVYYHMEPRLAAEDLIRKIRSAGMSSGGNEAVVSLILDGENAWEYYPGNGREFLRQFYGLLAEQRDIHAITPSEILSKPQELRELVPGSWINANFNVWIGAEEDNRAWDLLNGARDFFEGESGGVASERHEAARQELWISEGSDWCWWYGPEHSSANDEQFDALYRQHLGNIYRLLDGTAPDELAAPIKRPRLTGLNIPPMALLNPTIDGRETTYFEWLGAGIYTPDPRSGALHGGNQYVKELLYGYGESAIYLRLDFNDPAVPFLRDFEIRAAVGSNPCLRIHATVSNGSLARIETRSDQGPTAMEPIPNDPTDDSVRAAFSSIFELEIGTSLVALEPERPVLLQVSLWVNGLPMQTLPFEGRLTLALAEELVSW